MPCVFPDAGIQPRSQEFAFIRTRVRAHLGPVVSQRCLHFCHFCLPSHLSPSLPDTAFKGFPNYTLYIL